jgi:ribosomal protein L32
MRQAIDIAHVNRVRAQIRNGTFPMRRAVSVTVGKLVEELAGQKKAGYSKCPRCGYWAFDGVQCWDCGYRERDE